MPAFLLVIVDRTSFDDTSTVLVFYVGYILDDKNTLCNGCKLTGWSVFNSESSCIQTMFKSKKVTDHKLLEDVHEESLQNPRQNSRFLCILGQIVIC
jgi:hypothetical protein